MHSARPHLPYYILDALACTPMHLEELVSLASSVPAFYFSHRQYSAKTIFEEIITTLTPSPAGQDINAKDFPNFLTSIVKFSFNSFGDQRNNALDNMLAYIFVSALRFDIHPLTIVINMLPSNFALYCFNILAKSYQQNKIVYEDYLYLLTQSNEVGYTPLHYIIKYHPILLTFYLHALSSVACGEFLMLFHMAKTEFGDSYLDYIQYHGDAKILNLYIDHLLNSIEPAERVWSALQTQAQAKHNSRKLEHPANEFIQYLIKLGENKVRTKINAALFDTPKLGAVNSRRYSFIRNWREVPHLPPSPASEPLFNSRLFGPELTPVDNKMVKDVAEARDEDNGDFRLSYSLMF